MAKNKNNQAIWNTRIKKNASSLFQKVGNSIDIDKRLYQEDIGGSILIGYLFFDLAMYVIEFYGYQDKVENLKFPKKLMVQEVQQK